MKTPGTYKKEFPPTTDGSISQPPHSIQLYLDDLANPDLSTYRSPQHPCGLAHEGPCPVPINSRLDYDTVKDAITELDIQIQAQAPPQTGPHSYHHVYPRTPYGGLTMEELESDISRLYSIMQQLIHTIEVEEEQYQMAQDRFQRMAAERD